MSKEKGILFTTEMVRAILSGAKTQTRRVLKKAPHNENIVWSRVVGPWAEFEDEYNRETNEGKKWSVKLPYRVNDILYVKETYATGVEGCPSIGGYSGITYRADHQDPRGDGPANPIKWYSSMFMPKALARIWLEVLEVRVERLQNISHEDAIAEGMFDRDAGYYGFSVYSYAIANYRLTWYKINAKRGYPWKLNPWVAVYTFRRIGR